VPLQAGDTFVMGQGGHLWMVISDPVAHGGECVIVNLTTDAFRAGKECELNVGDHQWITEKCYVSMGDARKVTCQEEARILAYMQTGAIRKQFPLKPAVLKKIVEAAKASKAFPTGLQSYLDSQP
jgi:hypothetical protein